MGKFTELAKQASSPKQESLPDEWTSQFPILLEAFYPAPGKASGTFLTPKYSVTIFSEGCSLKAVVGAREGNAKYWLTLNGPEAVLEQIEMALGSGKGEWREQAQEK